jgi:hypothetical protein
MKAIEDLEKTATLYGDHAFLVYALSDGQSNSDRIPASRLSGKLRELPENWTVAVFVPDQNGVFEAKRFGFPADNVSIWNVSSATAIEDAGHVMQKATESFMRARSTGIRGTKSLFTLDASHVSASAVKSQLTELSPSQYTVFPVSRKVAIKEFVEGWTKENYQIGSGYYPITKPEKIQNHKQICIQHKLNGKVYTGAAARQMLGLPDHEVKVAPASHPDFQIFCQSTSVNRLLVPGTNLLVMK